MPLPVASLVHQMIQALIGRGYGDQDFAALIELEAQSSGLQFVGSNFPTSQTGSTRPTAVKPMQYREPLSRPAPLQPSGPPTDAPAGARLRLANPQEDS